MYVYAEEGGQHDLPHCHVYWPDGSCVVSIDDPHVLAGAFDRRAVDLVEDNRDAIAAEWRRLNPAS